MKKFIFFIVSFFILLNAFTTGYKTGQGRKISYTSFYRIIGYDTYKDKFFISEESNTDLPSIDKVKGETNDPSLLYNKHLVEIPLHSADYYYGKFINANAAVKEINQIGVLTPGSRIELLGDGYLTMSISRGYIDPGPEFMYASGSCWATSALGAMMDEVNKAFEQKYELKLFTFHYLDRTPHPVPYLTYKNSNHGYGYTITKFPKGDNTDFKFTINPELANNKIFKDLKIEIVMISRNDHPKAYLGQSIGAYIRTNIDF